MSNDPHQDPARPAPETQTVRYEENVPKPGGDPTPPSGSVLESLGPDVPRVLLPDPPTQDHTPVHRPSSEQVPAEFPPRYQIAGAGDTVVRMDTDSGELIACNQQRCARVEPPDRAKTFGPLTVQFDSEPEPALPVSNPQANNTP